MITQPAPHDAHAQNSFVDATHVPPDTARRLQLIGVGMLVVGLLAAGAGFAVDRHRFAYSWLTAFLWLATVALGGLIFVLIQFATKAGWSAGVRRHAEWIAGIVPLLAILFIPVAALAPTLYHEWYDASASNDALVAGKHPFLNPPFFFARAVVYLAVWIALTLWYRRRSLAQDTTGDPAETLRMQRFSPPALIATGLTVSFAGFDWVMSLTPHWYSTIFGVYILSGAIVSGLAALALVVVAVQQAGLMRRASNVEHRHDVGKLLFGFTVFWAYIAFCQYFLIWYANIPEETAFFIRRLDGNWRLVSLSLAIGQFAVPFFLLLSRTAKRSPALLATGAVIILAMHYIDAYWLVMPNLDEHGGASPSWIDAAALLVMLGVAATSLAARARREPLYPLRDPRLEEAAAVDNP